jgi:hypothetical protein
MRSRVLVAIMALAVGTAFSPLGMAQSSAPLLQQSDIVYQGAFALPKGTLGSSTFEYGGHGLTVYIDPSTGKETLFMEGHMQDPGNVAQVEVPASFVKSGDWNSLPKAKVLQNFAGIGNLGSVDPGNQYNATFIYGLLAYGGRLIVGASNSYSSSQVSSHGATTNLTLSSGGFSAFQKMNADAPVRATGGPMTLIPSEWQTALGGPALTGQCCISVISSTSSGPAATVFNPTQVGSATLSGKTVLYYPLATPVCGSTGCEASTNSTFNLTTRVGGMAFPSGSRTLLFVGGHGTGKYCYGTAAECGNDTSMPDVKGPHAQPYRYQIWAYDANDLVAVKNGTKTTSTPKPYGVWPLSEMHNSGNPNIGGAGFSPTTGRLFITQDYGPNPMVEVYQITQGVGGPAPKKPSPPVNTGVQ